MIFASMSLMTLFLDRQVEIPPPGVAYQLILRAEDQRALERFSRELELRGPIAVLAPDNPYAGYGIQSNGRGGVGVFGFNWLIRSYSAPLLESGRFPEGEDELTLQLAWTSAPGLVPNRGDAVAWAVDLLREHGVEPVYTFWEEGDVATWDDWIDDARRIEIGYEPDAVVAKLKSWGVELDRLP